MSAWKKRRGVGVAVMPALSLRIPGPMHDELKRRAAEGGRSLNQEVWRIFASAFGMEYPESALWRAVPPVTTEEQHPHGN